MYRKSNAAHKGRKVVFGTNGLICNKAYYSSSIGQLWILTWIATGTAPLSDVSAALVVHELVGFVAVAEKQDNFTV